ncbi:unnamed protein product [Protopolystoma xenopodis]|uniref:Uncharacterized protein n=1 Tax=Protopolystoma xenopodis TaxID=117903 RepID=A0A448WRL0_9PLAT|nr:unnamed protein product [Protopolystoma xenopodis]
MQISKALSDSRLSNQISYLQNELVPQLYEDLSPPPPPPPLPTDPPITVVPDFSDPRQVRHLTVLLQSRADNLQGWLAGATSLGEMGIQPANEIGTKATVSKFQNLNDRESLALLTSDQLSGPSTARPAWNQVKNIPRKVSLGVNRPNYPFSNGRQVEESTAWPRAEHTQKVLPLTYRAPVAPGIPIDAGDLTIASNENAEWRHGEGRRSAFRAVLSNASLRNAPRLGSTAFRNIVSRPFFVLIN